MPWSMPPDPAPSVTFWRRARLLCLRGMFVSSRLNLMSYICRVGEKYLDWVDEPLSADTILEMVSLYWLTETFPRAIYPYREVRRFSRYARVPGVKWQKTYVHRY